MEHLRVPRDREGSYQPTVVERYERRQEKVNGWIREWFLAGVSTRRVGEVLAPVLGEAVSPQTVSRVAQSLDAEVRRFHQQLLGDHYRYLFLDGITLRVKSPAGVKRRLVLGAYGITSQGQRALVSFRQATAESEAQWEAFLRNLYERGLEGKTLALVVTDDQPWTVPSPGHRVSLRSPTAVLGPQAEKRGRQAAQDISGGLFGRSQEDLSSQDAAGSTSLLPRVGYPVGDSGTQRGKLLEERPGRVTLLLELPPAPLEEGAHHQRHRTSLPGGETPYQAHELLPEQGERRSHHLRRH